MNCKTMSVPGKMLFIETFLLGDLLCHARQRNSADLKKLVLQAIFNYFCINFKAFVREIIRAFLPNARARIIDGDGVSLEKSNDPVELRRITTK